MTEPLIIRPLRRDDLAQALTIQAASYPAYLREDELAFASRIDLSAAHCLVAVRGEALVGYLLAHGWPRRSPPPVGTVLDPRAAEVLFIHDLAVGVGGRGIGVGAQLVERASVEAARAGLMEAELIAVEGAADYWRTLGFQKVACPPDLAFTVARYGAQACWMTRAISVASSHPPPSSATTV